MPDISDTDHGYIRRALKLAQTPVSAPHPNPRVGCVVVKNGKIVGEGFHRKAGCAHAEVNALDSCGEKSRGSVMYVTLEPCTVHGKTPPCVDRVIQSGVERVVVCTEDPNPLVQGRGIKMLRESGIQVDLGVLADEAQKMNQGFFSRHKNGKVWVTVKIAATLDGRIATQSGESSWITAEASRQDVQLLRAQASAILTGAGTVRKDNPRLNCRAEGAENSPLRVIVDSKLETSANSRMFDCDGDVLIATREGTCSKNRSKLEKVAEIVEIPSSEAGVDCRNLLTVLAQREVNEVLVEAGPSIVGSLVSEQLVDQMIVYLAPSLLGDRALGMATIPAIQRLSDRINGEFSEVHKLGDDIRITVKIKQNSVTQ